VHGLPESELLWLLHRLGIDDKHRTLNLVAAGVDVRLDVSTVSHPAYGLTGRTGYLPLEDGAEIYRIPLPANPSQVQDYSHSTFDVALDPKGPGRGISLRGDCVICGKRSRRRSDFANPLSHDSLFSNIALHLTLLTSRR